MSKRIFAVHRYINFKCACRSFSFLDVVVLTLEVGQKCSWFGSVLYNIAVALLCVEVSGLVGGGQGAWLVGEERDTCSHQYSRAWPVRSLCCC